MKKYNILLFFLLVLNFGFGQNAMIDNVKNHLRTKNPNDSTKVKAYYTLAQQYASFSKDSLILYTNKALALSLKTNNYLLPRIYNFKGIEFLMTSQPDSARFYLNKALTVLDETKDKETKAVVYQNFANSYEGTGEFEKQVNYLLKSIELLEDNPYNQCISIFNIGSLYGHLQNHTKTLEYYKKSYDVSKKGKNIKIENASLMALGASYLSLKKLDSAKMFLEKSLEICKKTNSSLSYFETYSKLGSLYDKMKLFKKAENSHIKAKKYAYLLGDNNNIMLSLGSLANHYLDSKNYKKASTLFGKFNEIYEKNPRLDIGVTAYRNWAKTEGYLGNLEKSGKLLDKYLSIKDSIYSKESKLIVTNAEVKFQTEKKDKEIAEQKLELAQNKTQLQKNKTQFSYMAGGALLVVVSSILLWFLYQQRQKRKNQEILTLKREHQVQTLESLMEGEEKERFRIAKELHDGVNGDLAAIKFKLSSLLEMNNTVIKEAVSMIDKSCQQVRAISHNLVPPSLQDFNLIEALEEYCTNMNAIHNPKISFQQIGNTIKLTKKQEANVFRIVQELVNNSIKHAEADEINVQISSRENTIQLTIEDNGKGYDKKTIKTNGIGLKNIQSRVDYLNASLDVVSNAQGTSTTIEIEINKPDEN